MSDGLLPDGGNFIVSENNLSLRLQKIQKAIIISELILVKTTDTNEVDSWSVVEKPSNIHENEYKNFKASIEETIDDKKNTRELKPKRQPTKKNPSVFEQFITFGRAMKKNEYIKLIYSYERPIKEIITEKGIFFRNRVILYVNSFSTTCDKLTVTIEPSKLLFKKERVKCNHCENIDTNGEIFYKENIVKHKDYVIQQFLSWKIIPPFFERFTGKIVSTIISALIGVLITILYYDELKQIISKIF